MKITNIIMGSTACLLLLSTAICGFWIRANNISDITSINFHIKIGSISVALAIISIVMLIMTRKS